MGRGRNRERRVKRKFRGNQFSLESSSSAKPPAKELDYSQDEASSLQPCSASQKKLSSPIPGWIVDKERDASSPYSNPDSSCEDDISSLSCSEDDSDAYSDDETTSSDSTDLNGTRLVRHLLSPSFAEQHIGLQAVFGRRVGD